MRARTAHTRAALWEHTTQFPVNRRRRELRPFKCLHVWLRLSVSLRANMFVCRLRDDQHARARAVICIKRAHLNNGSGACVTSPSSSLSGPRKRKSDSLGAEMKRSLIDKLNEITQITQASKQARANERQPNGSASVTFATSLSD